jgi:hypothetical protein
MLRRAARKKEEDMSANVEILQSPVVRTGSRKAWTMAILAALVLAGGALAYTAVQSHAPTVAKPAVTTVHQGPVQITGTGPDLVKVADAQHTAPVQVTGTGPDLVKVAGVGRAGSSAKAAANPICLIGRAGPC